MFSRAGLRVTDLPLYSYKTKLGGWNVVQDKIIQLPTKNGKPDYETMETFIKAVEKLVIKDVVLYADSKIEATKRVSTISGTKVLLAADSRPPSYGKK